MSGRAGNGRARALLRLLRNTRGGEGTVCPRQFEMLYLTRDLPPDYACDIAVS
jgi:hypothetical protein